MAMDMRAMMKQAQKMQAQMAKAQEELKLFEYEGTAGGGMVKVVATGEGGSKSISINPECVDPEDVEMLQDMILAAVNDALRGVAEEGNARMGAVTGGMRIPGLM